MSTIVGMSGLMQGLGSVTCRLLDAAGAHACGSSEAITAVGIVTLGVFATTGVLFVTRQTGA